MKAWGSALVLTGAIFTASPATQGTDTFTVPTFGQQVAT